MAQAVRLHHGLWVWFMGGVCAVRVKVSCERLQEEEYRAGGAVALSACVEARRSGRRCNSKGARACRHQPIVLGREFFSRKRRGIRAELYAKDFPWVVISGQRFPKRGGGRHMFGDRASAIHVRAGLRLRAFGRSMSSMSVARSAGG